jgi:eukaryotic-like serine/threonine-protein kinase
MTVLADRYELAEVIGSGGMARVLVARDRRLGRRVAVKLVRDDLVADPVSRERLLREARAAAALQHPNVVAVHDAGEEDGRAFIVMELIEGRTLADRLHETGRLTPQETVAVGGAVLDALEAAHRRGLVHRDVKPGNVLLPDTGGYKLADFGIAKALDAASTGLTATGHVLGTPRYLAPEQFAGDPATPASDLYSLGAVLYECLAGHPPFEADSAIALALAHQRDPLPPLAEAAPDVPPPLAHVVERALRKAPEERHADAASMATALRAADASAGTAPLPVDGAPTGSPDEPGWLPPAGSAVDTGRDRRRWWAVAAVVAAVVLAAVLVGAPSGDDGDPDAATGEGTATEGEARPRDLDDLVADLARDPGSAGARGDELLEGLLEVRRSDGEDQRQDARELMKEVAGWTADDELDPGTGGEALTLLEPLGRPPGPGTGEVSDLFAAVARDRPAWGEKGGDLLGKLDDLLDEDDPSDRAEDAEDLAEEVGKWIDEGTLDPERGRGAREVLERVGAGG